MASSDSTATDIKDSAYAGGRRLPAGPDVISRPAPYGWDGRTAALISGMGSPPVLACVVVALVVLKLSGLRAWIWGGIYVLLDFVVFFAAAMVMPSV